METPARRQRRATYPNRGEELLPPEDVRDLILRSVRPLPAMTVPLLDAGGLVLTEPVVAPLDLPSFDNAAMDGFAVVAADTARPPATLEVIGRAPAGLPFEGTVRSGQAVAIATGAPMPSGADAVVPLEEADRDGSGVVVRAAVEPGRHVRRAAEDVRSGEEVLPAGTVLGPGQVAAAAALGRTSVTVRPRPRVTVVPTGEEVRGPDQPLGPGQVHDAVSAPLFLLLREAGALPTLHGAIGDDRDRLLAVLRDAAGTSDVLLTVGGVSRGERDVVHGLETAGFVRSFRVALRPAKPFAFGEVAGTPLFGLPGNPASALAAFEELVRPGLLAMMGRPAAVRAGQPATLVEAFHQSPGRLHLVRGEVWREDGRLLARPAGEQGAGMIHSLARANCWIVVPATATDLPAGAEVEVRPLQELP